MIKALATRIPINRILTYSLRTYLPNYTTNMYTDSILAQLASDTLPTLEPEKLREEEESPNTQLLVNTLEQSFHKLESSMVFVEYLYEITYREKLAAEKKQVAESENNVNKEPRRGNEKKSKYLSNAERNAIKKLGLISKGQRSSHMKPLNEELDDMLRVLSGIPRLTPYATDTLHKIAKKYEGHRPQVTKCL